jgi:hypothetical protein
LQVPIAARYGIHEASYGYLECIPNLFDRIINSGLLLDPMQRSIRIDDNRIEKTGGTGSDAGLERPDREDNVQVSAVCLKHLNQLRDRILATYSGSNQLFFR